MLTTLFKSDQYSFETKSEHWFGFHTLLYQKAENIKLFLEYIIVILG